MVTVSLIFQTDLNHDELMRLKVTLADVVREVAKWTIGPVPFEVLAFGETIIPEPGIVVGSDQGICLNFPQITEG